MFFWGRAALGYVLGTERNYVFLGHAVPGWELNMGVDLLDIVYRLEKAFTVKIDNGDLFPDVIRNDRQGKYIVKGIVTEQGLEEIKKQIPFADLSSFEKNPEIRNIVTILTVKFLCDLVECKIREKNEDINDFPNMLLQAGNSVTETLAKQFNIADSSKIDQKLRLEQLTDMSDPPLPTDFWRRFYKIQRNETSELRAIKACVRSRMFVSIWKTTYLTITISLVCGIILWLGSVVWLHNALWLNDVFYLLTVLFVLLPIFILFGLRHVVNWKRCHHPSRVTVGEIIDVLVDLRPDHSVRGDGIPYSREEIEQIVAEVLCETLGVKPEEIRPEANIFHDLGAE